MRKIFMLCLTGALALATTSCKDEKVTTMQTITVNGQICEVKSAFYVEEKADEQWETSYDSIQRVFFNITVYNVRLRCRYRSF